MRSADLIRPRARLARVRIALAFAFAGLLGRAAYLGLVDPRGARRGEDQLLTVLRIAASRGVIVDREGVELALTLGAPSVYAVPALIEDPHATARALARTLRLDRRHVRRRLAAARGFAFVARWVDPKQAREVKKLGLAGIGIVTEPRRAYPSEGLAGRLIGFANIDGVGVRGIERREDAWLRGVSHRVAVERDARGRLLLGPGVDLFAAAGGQVALTLDAALQAEAEAALADAVRVADARGGLILCLEPRTGDLLALAEHPRFDPNRFREVAYPETRSPAFLDAFEPGSTLKPFLVAAAIEAGAVTADEAIDLHEGEIQVGGRWIRDPKRRERLDVAGILRISSNVGAVRIAQRLGPKRYHEALRRFGFGAPTRSGFPEESSGILRPWRSWRTLDQATMAFGQGIGVTAAQLAAATAALANGGLRVAPRLVAARRRPQSPWQPAPRTPSRRAVSEQTAVRVLAMLREAAAPGGTGHRSSVSGVRVAGKTGTAQKFDPGAGRYSRTGYVAWFAGVAPVESPRIVIVVGIDEPSGPWRSGGALAAPVFARVAAAYLTGIGIPARPTSPLRTRRPARARTGAQAAALGAGNSGGTTRDDRRAGLRPEAGWARVGSRILVPDFQGLTVEEVKRVTEGAPVRIEIEGRGRAVSQQPEPGTVLPVGEARVRIRFAQASRED